MEYLIVLYITYNNGKDTRKAIYTYDNETDMLGNFYSQVGSAIKDATVQHIMAKTMNTNGGEYEEKVWTRPEVKKDEQTEE